MLCTTAQYKSLTGLTGTAQDALLTIIIEGVSQDMAAYAGLLAGGVSMLEKGDWTHYLSPESPCKQLWLPARPVVSVTSVKEAYYEGFADADALTADEDYQLAAATGRITRVGLWLAGERTVQAVYTAGFTPPDVSEADGYSQGAGEVLLPDDIRLRAMQQSAFEYGRRDKLGLTGAGVQGGSFSSYARDELLPAVKQTMARYKRYG